MNGVEASAEGEVLRRYTEVDLQSKRKEYVFDLPRNIRGPLESMLQDPRDLPAALLAVNITLTTLPISMVMLYCCSSHLLGLLYLAMNYLTYMQRFMLTLHFTQHRRLFKQEYNLLNGIIPYVLCTLYGVPCGLYHLHHCVMHHVGENRQGVDLSSTEPFQRDNFAHFFCYWMRFLIGTWVELPLFAISQGRPKTAALMVTTEVIYLSFLRAAYLINPVAALWCWIIPFFFSTFLITFGNWSQHAFINPKGDADAFNCTYNCLACSDNTRTYNDGYHILHHLNSRLHWSELPSSFLSTLQRHQERDALVFQGIGFFDVGLSIFTGRLGFLVDHLVPCSEQQTRRSRSDWLALLRQRLQPVVRSPSVKA